MTLRLWKRVIIHYTYLSWYARVMHSRYLLTGIMVFSVLGFTACGSTTAADEPQESAEGPEAIEINTAPETTADPIDIDLPLEDSGAFAYDQWPSACELVEATVIGEVLPQAADLVQSSEDGRLTMVNLGGQDEEITLPEAQCHSSVGFEIEKLGMDDDAVTFAFDATIQAAGTPEYLEHMADIPLEETQPVGDGQCMITPNAYDCYTENVAFSIALDSRPYGQYFGQSDSTYLIDGEEVNFDGEASDFLDTMNDTVLQTVVKAAIDRLS